MFKKIVFMGTPNFAVPILNSLYKNGSPILAVYSQPPKKSMRGQKINKSAVQIFSENLNLNIRTPDFLNNNFEELEYFKSISPDIVIVAAYGMLIPKEFLKLPKYGFLNIHASLLPKWRGAAPVQRAIMNLDEVTGISIIKLVDKLDAGPIMFKKEIELNKEINTEQALNKLSRLSSEIILDCLDLVEIGKAKFVEQDNSQATYAKKITNEECKTDWKMEPINIIAKINGLYPHPTAHFFFEGERYKIHKAELSNLEGKTGTLLDDNLTVACKSGSVKILEIQRQGKKVQKVKEFLLGSKMKKGSILS